MIIIVLVTTYSCIIVPITNNIKYYCKTVRHKKYLGTVLHRPTRILFMESSDFLFVREETLSAFANVGFMGVGDAEQHHKCAGSAPATKAWWLRRI